MERGDRRRDLHHAQLIGSYFAVGLILGGIGVLLASHGMEVWSGEFSRRSVGMPAWLIGLGVLSWVVGGYELAYRIVKGPQPRGRHRRE